MRILNLIRYRIMFLLTCGKKKQHYKKKSKYLRSHSNYQILLEKLHFIENKIVNLDNKVENITYRQNLYLDYFVDPQKALPATGALAKRQLENLELLKEFVRICNKYKIDYWLDFGTLLGAKRHNAFVPWDDDIDVSMKKEDLLLFYECFKKELSQKYDFLLWDAKQSRLVFKKDTGAFLDIYAYNVTNHFFQPLPCFPAASYNKKISTDILYPLQEIKFYNVQVKAPNKVTTYLRLRYGNFEKLPKVAHDFAGHNLPNEYSEDIDG